jgi:hypothetical protein
MFGDEISIHKAVVTTKSQLSPFIKMPAIYKPYTAHLDIQLRRCICRVVVITTGKEKMVVTTAIYSHINI